MELDAYLVAAVRATPTAVMLGPFVGWMWLRKKTQAGQSQSRQSRNRRRAVLQYIAASVFAQFFGNAAFQKALERIGLAASVPITLGVLIVVGAILGVVLLKEPVSKNKVLAMITLIIAVVVLSLPTQSSHDSVRHQAIDVIVGSLWAAVAGFAYSFLGVTMRQSLQLGNRASTLMFLSGVTGMVLLWPYCVATLGIATIVATSPSQWAIMATAGIFNLIAFIAITTSLKLMPVTAVNLINASQVAMAAVAGVILFQEPVTLHLGIGIFLTIVGLMILVRRTRAPIVITD